MKIDSEEVSYKYVTEKIEQIGWVCRVGTRNQKGFDIEARKDNSVIKIEVKSRTIREYSPGGSYDQTTKDRRRFQFSDSQMKSADYFVCVFVGPDFTKAYVIPKNKFELVRQRTKEGNWLSFDPNRNYIIRDNQTIDVSAFAEGWNFLHE